jgi:hypothetical protein
LLLSLIYANVYVELKTKVIPMPVHEPNIATPELTSPSEAALVENLEIVARRLDHIGPELENYTGTDTYPDWWYQDNVSTREILDELTAEDTDPAHLSEYFKLAKREHDIKMAISGYAIDPFNMLYTELGVEVVARGFAAENLDGGLHAFVAERLRSASKNERITPQLELDVLRQVYDKNSITGLLEIPSDVYSDNLRPPLRSSNVIRWMRAADQGHGSGDTLEDTRSRSRIWMHRALSIAEGIDEADAAEYAFAASRGGVSDNANKAFEVILERCDRYGTERLRSLAAFTGIRAFEDYSQEQLDLMEELLHDPQTAAERLAAHDVTVVMVNRVGDYSGVLHDTAEKLEDGNGRTLFFEINSMGDVYRHMLKLQKLGIKPSTLVLSAHSAPGQFMVSDVRDPSMKRRDIATVMGRKLVRDVNDSGKLSPGDFGYSMHGMKGMARLMEDLMQPSRAIDDAEEDRGKKKVLFQACDAATEVESRDISEQGVKFSVGMDSVVGRLAADLLENGIHSDVDVYGAPSGVQLHKTRQGVRYTSSPDTLNDLRKPQHAVRARVANGRVTHQNIDEVVMHR